MKEKYKIIKLKHKQSRLKFWHKIVLFIANLFGADKLKNKIAEIDQEVLRLVKTDESEMQILREYDKLETFQKKINLKEQKIKEQRQLVKELIIKKNLEAREIYYYF